MNILERLKEDVRVHLDTRALKAVYSGEDTTAYPIAREIILGVIESYIAEQKAGKEKKIEDTI